MKYYALLTLLAVASCSDQRQAPRDARSVEAGRRAWASCASCHFVPDPALAFDRAWIEMIHTTT
jgi:hypothetical protein